MPQTLYIRTPFQLVAGSTASHYELAEDLAQSLTVRVNSADPERLKLQPIFPGQLTFKPMDGVAIPTDPSASSASSIRGNLFLELSGTGQKELGAAAKHFNYGLIFAYQGVDLDPTFFQETVVDPLRQGNGFKLVKEGATRLTTAAQIANAFARGVLSVQINPNKSALNCVFPTLVPDSPTSASITLVAGVRPQWNPYAKPPALTALSSEQILANADFVRIPIVYFYRMLLHLPAWHTLAADGHATHPFITKISSSEDMESPPVRWRRLRMFAPGSFQEGPVVSPAFEGLTANAQPPGGGTPLWTVPLNLLGEVFVRRPDGEAFRLEVRGQNNSVIQLSRPPFVPTDALDLTWEPPPSGAEPARWDLIAHAPVTGDPLALPFLEIPYGAHDEKGLTVVAEGETKRAVARRELVRPLQELLRTFGFHIVSATGRFERPLSWALREFQIYAGMATIAVEGDPGALRYADRLEATPNPAPYAGEVDGIFSEATAAALRTWRQNHFRCPVVIESWTVDPDDTTRRLVTVVQNLWRPSDNTTAANRAFVRDLTEHYTIPPEHIIFTVPPVAADKGRTLLGRYQLYEGHHGVVSTVQSDTSWTPDTDVTPERLVGRALPANPPPADQPAASTYKVISAVSVAEAEHVFDSLNGYDRAVMSMGVFHWTVFLGQDEAELPAYLALLRTAAPEEYDRFFGRFGIRPSEAWPALAGPPQPNSMYQDDQKKWTAHTQQRGLLDNSGAIDPGWRSPRRIEDANYLRTWHWFYRWVMANRTSTAVQRWQWYLGRLRLRAILNAGWGAHPAFPTSTPQATSIGQVYSSERMVTALLRAHVHAPGTVISNGQVSWRLREAYANGNLTNHDPNTWTQADMNALQAALEDRLRAYNAQLLATIPAATGHVDPTLGALRTDRDSFTLDTTDLP